MIQYQYMKVKVYKSEYNNKYEFNLIHTCGAVFNFKGMTFSTEQQAKEYASKFISKTKLNIGECKQCWKPL